MNPAELRAHLLNAADLSDVATDIEAGRHRLSDGRSAATLSPTVRNLLARELWVQSHAVHEWLLMSHDVPMSCVCPVWCNPTTEGVEA